MGSEEKISDVSAAFNTALDVISTSEPTIADHIRGELANQRSQLKLIASENYASPAVLLAMGNWFSDKYAEGTPGHRFYAGCEYVDKVETLASDHAKELFNANYAMFSLTLASTLTWLRFGPFLLTESRLLF